MGYTLDEKYGIINESCDTALDRLLENGVKYDLILTDPPYNIGKDFGNDSDDLPLEEYLQQMYSRIDKMKELLSDNGSIVWFGSHRYICYFQVYMYSIGLHYRRMNIWRYENGMSRFRKEPTATYEPFLWFSKSNSDWTYNADDVRVPYKSTERLKYAVKKKDKDGVEKVWVPSDKGAMRGDIWEFPTLAGKAFEKERTNHPSQKPQSLIMELIRAFCPKMTDTYNGEVVSELYCGNILDPFHGSGTLGLCCEILNHLGGHHIRWTGIEIEKQWCDLANERIKKMCREIQLI